ncbi:disulfide isomerase, putative [Talaromyces stipitatus ATCC 10500]|uniref:protein disulfide-isomerase n=1 Tax=Talaromyces stipitatus (strain ATCC 10500 / CBS 375.48 / QM 6759 / NRRL 1006) TaxID=441959 RepID=B8MH64_TALSN|nr:disulfide isomerase, putative [Talaromyces stipitatus ATCC 10500]EED16878.1 disulfide isomerase, putative [Talaromyces stipitatus ATCC 10500]
MPNHLYFALLASLLGGASAAGLYTKSSPVLQVDAKNFNSLINKSNHTSIVEFYAPWCGHCQNLKPAYEKAAKNLEGLAKVAAVNCDDDENKAFCGQMGVQGFPTLKIIVPGKKPGKPRVEDYQGQRSAKAIVDAVVERIPNHVKKLTDKDYETWLSADESPKALLFTEKGTTGALLRSLAVDFLGGINFAQIRSKESKAVEQFGINSFPTLVLLPNGASEPIKYEGEMKKAPMLEFLSQVAKPNPDPAPAAPRKKSSSPKKPTSSSSSTVTDSDKSTDSPSPKVEVAPEEKPVKIPVKAPEVAQLSTPEDLGPTCLNSKSGTCILILLPETESADAELPSPAKEALSSVSELAHKLTGHHLPFYSVPAINSHAKILRTELGLSEPSVTEIIAVNGRRGWWRRYSSEEGFGLHSVEGWIDAIRLGEGSKSKLPEGVIKEEEEEVSHDEL